MNLGTKVLIFLIVLSLVSFLYFQDKIEDPKPVLNPDNSTTMGCDYSDGFILRANPTNASAPLQCYREATFGHIKYTFLMAFAMAMWTSVGIIFYIEYKKKDESSVVAFCQDKYQSENKPIPKCPDTFYENGFVWTFKGYDQVISSTEPVLFVGKQDMVTRIEKSLQFNGAREELTPIELYEYIGRDAKLFKRMTGADILGFISNKPVRREGTVPKIYFPRPLPFNVAKSYYSLKGNYVCGADRISEVIPFLYQLKRSIEHLDKHMDDTFKKMMQKGESYVASTARTGMEADKTRRTDTAESTRTLPRPQYDEERRQI